VTTYDGKSLSHTLTVLADAIVPSTIYKLKYRAVNEYGYSDFSEELNIGVASFPLKPNPVTKVLSESGTNFITLTWQKSLNTELPVIGYLVNSDGGNGGAFKQIYDGRNYPNVLKLLVSGLPNGKTVKFTV